MPVNTWNQLIRFRLRWSVELSRRVLSVVLMRSLIADTNVTDALARASAVLPLALRVRV